MKLLIKNNVSLNNLNSFGVAANSSQYIEINSEEDLIYLYRNPNLPSKKLILGGGSNILFIQDYNGIVIRMAIQGIKHEIVGNDVYVTAGAGVVWNDLVWYCVDNGLCGIENLVLIPGTVGASPVQNIGAYGVELMNVFHNCHAFDTQTGDFITLNVDDCKFSYRDSIFKKDAKNKYIITSVTLKLSTQPKINISYGAIENELNRKGIKNPSIRDVAVVVASIRTEKLPDPSTIGNAGSFFKNPLINRELFIVLQNKFPEIVNYPAKQGMIKIAAGWLIEQCGWKGKRVGNCGTWKNQALVLVNFGQASGKEIFQLSELIINDVQEKFGITLEREVNII